jgi:hypothetical protein
MTDFAQRCAAPSTYQTNKPRTAIAVRGGCPRQPKAKEGHSAGPALCVADDVVSADDRGAAVAVTKVITAWRARRCRHEGAQNLNRVSGWR